MLIPHNHLALPSSPSAPAVLPAGLSERGARASGGGQQRARHIGARRAPREGGAVNTAPGGIRPCNVDICKGGRDRGPWPPRPGMEKKLDIWRVVTKAQCSLRG